MQFERAPVHLSDAILQAFPREAPLGRTTYSTHRATGRRGVGRIEANRATYHSRERRRVLRAAESTEVVGTSVDEPLSILGLVSVTARAMVLPRGALDVRAKCRAILHYLAVTGHVLFVNPGAECLHAAGELVAVLDDGARGRVLALSQPSSTLTWTCPFAARPVAMRWRVTFLIRVSVTCDVVPG